MRPETAKFLQLLFWTRLLTRQPEVVMWLTEAYPNPGVILN